MTVLENLKDSILTVICEAELWPDGGEAKVYLVSGDALYILQQEYNIHFVEPDEEQVEWIEK